MMIGPSRGRAEEKPFEDTRVVRALGGRLTSRCHVRSPAARDFNASPGDEMSSLKYSAARPQRNNGCFLLDTERG